MNYLRVQHTHPDSELVSQRALAEKLGVTRKAIEKAIESGRIDTFENTKGVKKLHPTVSSEQFHTNKAKNKVTTPTRGQKSVGMDNLSAQAVAHLPMTNPGTPRNTQEKKSMSLRDAERIVSDEKESLASSRAEKEKHQARLAELKVLREEGTLVDKNEFFQKAYTVTTAIQDQLNGLAPQVTPQITSAVEEALVKSGLEPVKVREIMAKSDLGHTIREAIRTGVTKSLRDLTSKPLEDIFNGNG